MENPLLGESVGIFWGGVLKQIQGDMEKTWVNQ
jgi:hypothetical protein